MSKPKLLSEVVDRHTTGIKCQCGGYAAQADVTDDEDRKYGCGRRGCCSRAFVCGLCGTRWVGAAEAPEME